MEKALLEDTGSREERRRDEVERREQRLAVVRKRLGQVYTDKLDGKVSELSDSSHPATIATISYTPFGAFQSLQNGCVGTGCLQTQENYAYNNRLQPVEIQLGTSTYQNLNYCLVYNYYVGVANATTCTNTPAQATTGNNGNVIGYYYQDMRNPTLQHQVTNIYDSLNRLTTSTASAVSPGTVSYNFAVAIDRWGNATCNIYGNPSGPTCGNVAFNTSTNRISTIGGVSVSYDAAGDLTTDASLMPNHTYQWDAEGHLISVDNGSAYLNTYNALGQQVEKVLPGYQNDFVYDTSGRQIGEYSPPNKRWDWRSIMLGDRVIANEADSTGGQTLFPHANHLHSTTVVTDYTGSTLGDQLFYPWGQQWTNGGSQYELHFGGMSITDEGNYEALVRFHSPPQGRWLTPDPLRGNILNPQSLNRYAYVLNNPTSLTDPLGLDAHGAPPCGPNPDQKPCPQPQPPDVFQASVGQPPYMNLPTTLATPEEGIFNALAGEPGTYLTVSNGNIGSGFSIDLWRQTFGLIDRERAAFASLGANPGFVPTSGFVVMQTAGGTYGLVPELNALRPQLEQLVSMLPSTFQADYQTYLPQYGAEGALSRAAQDYSIQDPAGFASFQPYLQSYANTSAQIYGQLSIFMTSGIP